MAARWKRSMAAEHLSEPLRGPPPLPGEAGKDGSAPHPCGAVRHSATRATPGSHPAWISPAVMDRRFHIARRAIFHRPAAPKPKKPPDGAAFPPLRLLPPPSASAVRTKKRPPQRVVSSLCRRRPIFPVRLQTSIFGTTELNFRVRDGNGWTLSVINTYYLMYQKYIEN